jgi:hypothetical protein
MSRKIPRLAGDTGDIRLSSSQCARNHELTIHISQASNNMKKITDKGDRLPWSLLVKVYQCTNSSFVQYVISNTRRSHAKPDSDSL